MAVVSFAQTPPPNDDYENRTPISGTSVIFSGTTVGATLEPYELDPPYFSNPSANLPLLPTAWWTWTAPASGQVSIDLIDYSDERVRKSLGNEIASFLGVWHDVNWTNIQYDLFRQGECEHGFLFDVPGHRHTEFYATAGAAYDIQVSALPYGTFTVRLLQTNAPIILVPPPNRVVSLGQSTFLGVVAGGLPSKYYQWRFDGSDIPQQTNVLLSLDNIDRTMAGSYSVVISDGVSTVESQAAMVTIRTNDVQPTLQCLAIIPGSAISFSLSGESLTYYRIESSTNLTDWSPEESFPFPLPYEGYTSLIFNKDQQTAFTVPITESNKFIRAVRYTPNSATGQSQSGTEICINNLRKIRFAKELWDNDQNTGDWTDPATNDSATDDDLSPYGVLNLVCPLDGNQTYDSSYDQLQIGLPPVCNIDPNHHVLEEPSEIR